MTFISRKTRLLLPHVLDESDPGYLYQIRRKRSDGRLKRHSSCDDLRAWVDDEYLNYQYLLELMSNGEGRPSPGYEGKFVPIEAIVDILNGKPRERSFSENGGKGVQVRKLEGRPGQYDWSMSETGDDCLRLVDAAVRKLEAISNVVHSDEDRREGDESPTREEERINKSNSEEYNSTMAKIAFLEQRLNSIQQRRDDLNAKLQLLCRTQRQHSSSGVPVTELYNREEQTNVKRLQKMIEKLIAEKGQVLEELCLTLKYLKELKNNVDSGGKRKVCICRKMNSSEEYTNDETRTELQTTFKKGRHEEGKVMFRMCAPYPANGNADESQESSDVSFASLETLPVSDSQKTYDVAGDSITDGKFKSDTTMTEVEQTVRSYAQRLNELGSLEAEVEELKRRAEMADHFKKKWLKSVVKGKNQKSGEEEMKREIDDMQKENAQLKKMLQKLADGYGELQRLRCKAKKVPLMQELVTKLKGELSAYQLSCDNQSECIVRLKNTVREQREEIDRLMTHMTKLCRITQKLKDVKGANKKKSVTRSRSFGSEREIPIPEHPGPIPPQDEIPYSPSCCGCNRCTCIPETLNRPRSECGRRLPHLCCESIPREHMCRNQSCYN